MTGPDLRETADRVSLHDGDAPRVAVTTFHSFVFAVAPALAFLVANMRQLAVPATEAIRAVAVLLCCNLLLLLLLWRIRSARAAAVTLTALWIILSFYTVAFILAAKSGVVGRELPFASAYVAAGVSAALWIGRPPKGRDSRYSTLNVAAGTLLVVCLGMSVLESTPVAERTWAGVVQEVSQKGASPLRLPSPAPDIYYIVLDGLGRADVLRERYGVDVSPNLHQLRTMGWVIPDGSRTNYSQTYLSLASALNGTYLNPIARVMEGRRDRRALEELIQRAAPIVGLKRLGYRFRLVGSNTSVTRRHRLADECDCRSSGLSEFENGLLTITPFRSLPLYRLTFGSHYQSVLTAFDRIAARPRGDQPEFVLAHVIVPHPPFVLDRFGRARVQTGPLVFGDGDHFAGTEEEYRSGYAEQARFTMSRLIHFASTIHGRGRPAVVVVHGDHGPGAGYSHESYADTDTSERFPIFWGIRLEGMPDAVVPSDMSPVNTFRLIFNQQFGTRDSLLPSRSYYSTWEEPYSLTEVDVQ